AFFTYEYLTFRQATLEQSATLARAIAANSTAVLTFGNQHDAEETLSVFEAEGSLVAAALYDANGNLFSYYPTNLPPAALPETPQADGFHFGGSYLTGFEPVVEKGNRKGTLYLKFDTGTVVREWLRVSALIGVGVIGVVLLVTYLVSRKLQQQISQPILALAETAKAVAARRDYSVRATKVGENELGLLTDAFNQMLGEIQKQNQALRESEGRVRAVLNSALSAVVVIDSAGRITDWNSRAERMFGWTRAEALGLVLAETIIPPRFRDAHLRGLEHYLATGEGPVLDRPVELSALRRDATEFPVELSISQMKAGDVVTFCGFITDISERKRQEEMRARFVAIVQSSDDAIMSETREGILTSWNPGAERLFGYTSEEILGKPMTLLLPPEGPEEETEILTRVAHGASIPHFDTVRIRKDGTAIEVSVSISPIKDVHGKTVSVSTIARDITARKRAEQQVLLQATALETAANGIMITDRNGTILWTNPAFSTLTGYAPEEVMGRNPRLLKTGKHDPAFYKDLWGTILKGLTWRGSFTNRRKDGTLYQDEHTITPVRSADGTITHFIAIMQDVTERIQAQRVLRKSESQLRLVWENSLDAKRLVDEAGIIRMVNDAYCHMIGKPREALEGQPMSVLYDARKQEQVLREHRERFRSHSIPAHHETDVTLWNGKRLILELSNSFLDVEGR
ncbi:MAG TPA: PAS domain S-box protein, partial [Verrucomicrobiae bacterium]|nr:PAS domain S-box protein [Verrucomicrobiae bacterium]